MAVPETADEISHHEEYEDDVIVEIEGGVQELGASACKVCQLIGKAIRANEVPFAPEMKTLLFRWSRPVIGAWGSFTYRDEVRGDRWQGSSNFKSIFGAGHSFYTQSPPLVSNFDLGGASKIALQEISDLSTELPATIEDSITVTKRLGYQYLWVDRYVNPCVQQNSTEKHLQIQQMDVIYASAQITLIAAAGEDWTYGLPGVGEKRERKFASQSITIDSITLNLNLRPSGLFIAESVWFTRAW
ncbi:hypothetical protein AG0111_0g9186 [Alternaria gaisen]|uniref:Uncharacterized protein n=1 Tax=Alternaria gaisen TaxID=167740 RepID=A0ACB6FFJ9_9PLEO|nr:hypothetical protein AG0111_0g9186 [Alternaria gaisen]